MFKWSLTAFFSLPEEKLIKQSGYIATAFLIAFDLSFVPIDFVKNCAYSISAACIFYMFFEWIPSWRSLRGDKYMFLKTLSRMYYIAVQFDELIGLTSDKKFLGVSVASARFFRALPKDKVYRVTYNSTIPHTAVGGIEELKVGLDIAFGLTINEILLRDRAFLKELPLVEEQFWRMNAFAQKKHLDKAQIYREQMWSLLENIKKEVDKARLGGELEKIARARWNITLS